MNIAPEEEDVARALLHMHVADIDPAADLIDRIEDGVRRRRTVRRTALSATALVASACLTMIALAIGHEGNQPDTAASGRPEIACQTPLPPSGLPVVPPAPTVPGSARILVPGRPVAAVSCSVGGDTRTVRLSDQEIGATAAALNSAAPAPTATAFGECMAAVEPYTSLYLIFEYGDGAQLTVVASPSIACDLHGSASWQVDNGAARGVVVSPVLDSLSNRDGTTPLTR